MTRRDWLTGDLDGLEKIARRRNLSFLLFELLQNAWDTSAKNVRFDLIPIPGRPLASLEVEDDSEEGFADLDHSFTLFAESTKKSDPEKRGRFNLGEKLVLSLCDEATIHTVGGVVRFDREHGRRVVKFPSQSRGRPKGTLFMAKVRLSRPEIAQVETAARLLIVPEGIRTEVQGSALTPRHVLREFTTHLMTELAGDDGILERKPRKTRATIHACLPTRNGGRLYEMGIPVCETGDPWDVNVHQKIPLNLERSGVSPGYLRSIRVHAVNAMRSLLTKEDATAPCVQEALGDDRVLAETAHTILALQFGPMRAITDPSDREAENRLKAEGYTIIPSRGLSVEAFAQVRRHGAAKPAGQISPSYKPYDAGGKPRQLIGAAEWSPAMAKIAAYTAALGHKLLGSAVFVNFEGGRGDAPWTANYDRAGQALTFNHARLGDRYFERAYHQSMAPEGSCEELHDLLIHEFAHQFGDHLTHEFDEAMSRLGAKLVTMALDDPSFFHMKMY